LAEEGGRKGTTIGPYMNLGMQLAVAVIIGMALGYWLDSILGTSPLFLLLGVLAGGTAGFMNIYRTVYPDRRDKDTGAKQ